MSKHVLPHEIQEHPAGYTGPNLTPVGLELHPRELGSGSFALLANVPPKDNNGVVFGDRAGLVIDAGITPDVGARIRRQAGELAPVPLTFLVNTTYHGDHTFGNLAFDDLTIVTSRINGRYMHDLEREKHDRTDNMHGDEHLFDAFDAWRRPDLVFDTRAEIDLGGRVVELHHFGPGNGPGDTVVYDPSSRAAWTGNFLCVAGSPHMLLQAGPEPYLESLRRMREALPDLETIVPGHGPAGDGHRAISALIRYLERLRNEVGAAFESGYGLAETYDRCTDPWAEGLTGEIAAALAGYDAPAPALRAGYATLARDLHRLNILTTYRVCERLAA